MTTPASMPTINAKRVRLFHFIYDHVTPKIYNFGQIPGTSLKKVAVKELDLKCCDHVVVFCCGTGLEFSFIQTSIGPEGEILGVDWSDGMLEGLAEGFRTMVGRTSDWSKAMLPPYHRVSSKRRLTTREYACWACPSLVSRKKLFKH
jgi:hypothetical protein